MRRRGALKNGAVTVTPAFPPRRTPHTHLRSRLYTSVRRSRRAAAALRGGDLCLDEDKVRALPRVGAHEADRHVGLDASMVRNLLRCLY